MRLLLLMLMLILMQTDIMVLIGGQLVLHQEPPHCTATKRTMQYDPKLHHTTPHYTTPHHTYIHTLC